VITRADETPVVADEAPVLAVDVGGTTIKAELVAGDRILGSDRRPTPRGAAAVDAIGDLGDSLLRCAPTVPRAGVVLPGVVDRHRGVGVFSANVGWDNVPAGPQLAGRWGIPVVVDHDVMAAGWAEWRRGAGRGVDDLAFVAVGTGISAALVSGGRLVRGGSGQAGELGHVVVRPDGPPCGCGARGCLEAVASATAIAHAYQAASGQSVAGAVDVLARAAADAVAQSVVTEAVAALADGLAALVQLVAPARIVIGGGLADAGASWLDAVRTELDRRCRVVPAPPVVAARFGARAGVVGAALLARLGPIDAGGES
jgi:glucokinase